MYSWFFVPWEIINDLQGIRYRYSRVRAFSPRHAEFIVMMRFRPLDVRVQPHKIVEAV